MKTIADYANPPGLAAGTPDGSYALSGAESIDYFSGHLSYDLPLLQIGGRGEAGYTVSLKIPSRWEASTWVSCAATENFGSECFSPVYYANFGDYHAGVVGYGPGVIMLRNSGSFGDCQDDGTPPQRQYGMTSTRATIVFVDSHGSEHELFDKSPTYGGQFSYPSNPSGACSATSTKPNRGRIFASRDGSALTYIADGDVVDSAILGTGTSLGSAGGGRLYFPNGTMYRVNVHGRVTYIRDRFGNITTFTYNTSEQVETVTDAVGRQVTFTYSTGIDTITYPAYGGGTNSIQIYRGPLANQLRPDFQSEGTKTTHELFATVISSSEVNPTLPASVRLPNGREYTFRYNQYAELAQVELPTGGRYEYDWRGGETIAPDDGYVAFHSSAPQNDDLTLIHRVVKERRAYTVSSGGTPVRTTYFEPGTLGSGASREVAESQHILTAPQVELHWYNGSPITGSFLQPGAEPYWNHGKETKTEVWGAGTTLKTTENEWVQLANLTPVLKSVTTKLSRTAATALWSKTEHEYDLFANVTQTTETDWGLGVVGTVKRKRITTYVTDPDYTHANETEAADFVVHLRRLPLSETILDGADTQQARTEYIYDESGYQEAACPGITRHDTHLPPESPSESFDSAQYLADNPMRRDTSFLRFGNVTSARSWVAGSTWISTHAKYDIAGNAVWTQDGKGITATASYSGANACAYPSQVTVGTTPQLTSTMAWNLATGKITSHTDPHNVVTTYGYESALGRMTSRWTADGSSEANQATAAYDDTNRTVTTGQDLRQPVTDPLNRKRTVTVYDGLGRLYEERQKTDTADIVVRTEYDALGRVLRRSIPAATPTYWETFTYDALGRVTRRSWDDGSHEDTQYQTADFTSLNADQTKITDAAGKWRVLATDGLGRLIKVREAPSANEDATYTYDALDNLLGVDQEGRTRSFVYDGVSRLRTATNPESGTITYAYDDNGNLTQKTDARGIVTTISYDDLNRPLTKSYSGDAAPDVVYTYNLLRLLSVATDAGVTQAYTYTPAGRIATSTQTVGGVDFPFSLYTYYMDGSLASVTYPSGRTIRYPQMDSAGRITQVEGTLGGATRSYVMSTVYNGHGLMESMQFAAGSGGVLQRWSYSPKRLQPYDIRLGELLAPESHGRWEYSYCAGGAPGSDCASNNGNVMHQRIQPLNRVQNYAYDGVNRLALMEEKTTLGTPVCAGGGTNPCQAFGYDRWSNMYVSQTQVVTPHAFTPISGSNFNTKNQLLIQSSVYDDAGNQTVIGGYTRSYDGENRLVSSVTGGTTTSYVYDGNGQRVKKTVGGASTWYVYDATGNLAAEYTSTGPTGAAATHFVVGDHLGSTRVVLDNNANVVSRHDYLPFGEEINAGVGGRTTGMMYVANNLLTQRFTGKERDTETGLDYFGARYLSGVQGRFVSADEWAGGIVDPFSGQQVGQPGPLPYADITDPQTINKYAYVRNNALRYTDPDGHCTDVLTCSVEFGGVGAGVAGPGGGVIGVLLGATLGPAITYVVTEGLKQNPSAAGSIVGAHAYLAKPAQATGTGGQAQQGSSDSSDGKTDGEQQQDNKKTDQHKSKSDTRATKPEKNTLEGAQNQRESISHAQSKLRSQGEGERIRSIDKSLQREQNQLNRIKTLKDAEQP